MKSLALTYAAFGKPEDVLILSDDEIPDTCGPGCVLVKLLAAPIHPSDIGMISGRYGVVPQLPSVAGREGVGEIIQVGQGSRYKIGDRVRFPGGTWRTLCVAREDELFRVPRTLDTLQAAMAFINPLTAWMILNTIVDLKPGDWIIQNAANSAVGLSIIGLANSMGINSINLLRNVHDRQDLLISRGATVVLDDATFDTKSIKEVTGGELPRLGLNSVGGSSAMNIIKSMGYGGTVVTIGGMVSDLVRFPTRELIFNDIHLRGFWLDKYIKSQTHEHIQSLYDKIYALIEKNIINIPIDMTVNLSSGPANIFAGYGNAKNGKVLIIP